MIHYLDHVLRHLFLSTVHGLHDETQVRFDPPDDNWRRYVGTLDDVALNVYLFDLRQNRSLRGAPPTRTYADGQVRNEPAPARIDLHYLVTAWSPAAPASAVEPSIDEHALLHAVAATLLATDPVVPSAVYRPHPLPVGFPDSIADTALPTTVLPSEGFPKYAEFWGTMAGAHPWRPAVYLTITIPVAAGVWAAGPLVTTQLVALGGDATVQIAGTVTDPAGRPVPRAWVRVIAPDTAGRVTRTDDDGRYTITGLATGTYRLRVRVAGFAEAARDIDVPGAGGYDVGLTPT